MIEASLRAARGTEAQRALDDWLQHQPPAPRAVLIEGLQPLDAPPDVAVVALAPGCPCCVGVLALRVALVRLLRQVRARSLLVLISDASHLTRLRVLATDGTLGVTMLLR